MIRNIVIVAIATVSTAAAPPFAMPAGADADAVVRPDGPQPGDTLADRAVCRDRIWSVRAEAGQPELDRTLATGETGYLIAAVDKRIDGCAVMQMHGDVTDLRPLPELNGEPPRLRPID